ncbi:MAG TPA: hypothetical protein VN783_02925 [Thermoanaerobaculia bacterium]|nr:hypothetical protein [Thermoanaerobaculia bacterium]
MAIKALLDRFDPPAHLPDFNDLPGLLDQWDRAMIHWFNASIASEQGQVHPGDPVQFYNPRVFDPGGIAIDQAVTWNAFPKEQTRRFGRERALREADKLTPLSRAGFEGEIATRTFFRSLNEYCEWHVVRDPDTDQILRVTFTSEPPEYWQALYGGTYDLVGDGTLDTFSGSPARVLKLYRELVSPAVQPEDLICQESLVRGGFVIVKKGDYNPYNKWNTTHGIVHLCSPPNTITAEIQLGADATILRQDPRRRPLVEPDALICCSAYGGPDRNSDPTIGAAVNALARLGAYVTLRNPVGLYMDHIELGGWSAPDGRGVTDCVRIVRGGPQTIERLVVEVPAARGFTVSELKIGGVPIQTGGQIAECITVRLVGTAVPSRLSNRPVSCIARCCIDPHQATTLGRPLALDAPIPPGKRPAFVDQGTVPVPLGPAAAEAAGAAAPAAAVHPATPARAKFSRRILAD